MSDTIIEPVTEVPEEKIYRYQPLDEHGRPIGGEQVLKYTTQEELTSKLVEQNNLLIRKLREKTKKERLGIVETEEISPEVARFQGPIEFKPRDLTNEEYAELARDLTDPNTAVEAQRKLVEASFGAAPEAISSTLQSLQEQVLAAQAVAEATAFMTETPEYFQCQENGDAIVAYLSRYGLAPTRANYRYAYDKLMSQDPPVLIQRPVAAPVVPAPVTPVEEAVPVRAAQPKFEGGIPTGFNRDMVSDEGTPNNPSNDITYQITRGGQLVTLKGLDAINAMPGDEYGRRLRRDPSFAKKVEKLYGTSKGK